jgi:nitrate/TMAO reductase-like tetraheme cytochrome c subunit
MTADPATPRPRRARLRIGAAGALFFAAGAVGAVKVADQDNRFCVACHLHEDIYRTTLAAPPASLAAAHSRAPGPDHPERCFTCHSGEGVVGWSQVTLLSAWDAGRWVFGDRHEPASMRLPIENAACLKCHAAAVKGNRSEEETAKYHELSAHRGVRLACVSCHVTHSRGERRKDYLDDAVVRARCQGCHHDLQGEG